MSSNNEFLFFTVFPELIVYDIRSSTRVKIETIYFTDCTATWSDESQKTYQIILLAVLYISPFLLMSVAYHQIVRVLWTNDMPVNSESKIISCSKWFFLLFLISMHDIFFKLLSLEQDVRAYKVVNQNCTTGI